ncbi:hypothetical protein [Sorangium sp. So ce204]|uniref:hypothetical protein n=1 Tax=Sorangium sp. So ce204 TaxID=3133288 RepID=UPI003F623DC1
MRVSRIFAAVGIVGLSFACGSSEGTGSGGEGGVATTSGPSSGAAGGSSSAGGSGGTNAGGGGTTGTGGGGETTGTGGASATAGSGEGGAGTGVGGAGTGGAGGAFASGTGAGGTDGVGGAGGPDTGVEVPTCAPFGSTCARSGDCCSGICDSATSTCASPLSVCLGTGAACEESSECCGLNCASGRCSATACVPDGSDCTAGGAACCSGMCVGGTCSDVNGATACQTGGNPCTEDSQCCSQLCGRDNRCVLYSSFCVQRNDVCKGDSDCCTGVCVKRNTSDPAGYCGAEPSTASRCSSGGIDGAVCDSCGFCCSRVCAPYGPTGIAVCQPPSGCRVNGALCRRNEDCCGGDPTAALPGAGRVVCDTSGDPDGEIGRCRNPNGCTPQGGVCHFKDSYCSDTSTSAPNNCCGYLGNASNCRLDALGVPRCNALTACRQAGEDCASADDCCDGAPCVRNSETGKLQCYDTPGGTGPQCVTAGGPCTNNGDCCVGTTCEYEPGSLSGTCTTDSPSGATGSSSATGGTGGAGGAGGGGGSDGAGGTPPRCAEYGQLCGATSDCCNAGTVQCYNGICRIPPG